MIQALFLFFLQISLFAADFDCILVGTSPFSLFEALYQSHSGKKVLILEGASECGGAWKAIEICGISHVDLGCHQIGQDLKLKTFLEEYAGCEIVSMDNPLISFEPSKSSNGYYFSHGCFELIDHLMQMIGATDIVLLTNQKVEDVSINASERTAHVKTKDQLFTTKKLILTPMSCLTLASQVQKATKSKYYHLYLLIQDPTPPRFTYQSSLGQGTTRIMNLTHFLGMALTGRQLVVVQLQNEQNLQNPQPLLEMLIKRNLLDPAAYILKAEPYIYEAGSFQQNSIKQLGAQDIIEILQTGHFQGLTNYIAKWKQALKPYKEAVGRF